MSAPTPDQLLNDFAIRSFRDIADSDYIAARLACRSQLVVQYLWASQQAIEKYLKCILLLHRIPAKKMRHNLNAGLSAIASSGRLTFGLHKPTEEFISYLDQFGQFRYLEISNVAFGRDIVRLDRAVWELRRFCTLDPGPRQVPLIEHRTIPLKFAWLAASSRRSSTMPSIQPERRCFGRMPSSDHGSVKTSEYRTGSLRITPRSISIQKSLMKSSNTSIYRAISSRHIEITKDLEIPTAPPYDLWGQTQCVTLLRGSLLGFDVQSNDNGKAPP